MVLSPVLIDAHPDMLRALPELAVSCGMREGELFGIALEDFDFSEKVVRVRRQIKNLRGDYLFALPESDRERIIPPSDWTVTAIQQHVDRYPPRPCTLPWEKLNGTSRTYNILFRWHIDDRHVKARNYSEVIWKPASSRQLLSLSLASTGAAGDDMSPLAGKASTSTATTMRASCWLEESRSRNSRSISGTRTRLSPCASMHTCCRVLMTGLAP
jgi:integrase